MPEGDVIHQTAARLNAARLDPAFEADTGVAALVMRVYRRAGRPCPRRETQIISRPQGDSARMTYWCLRCQP